MKVKKIMAENEKVFESHFVFIFSIKQLISSYASTACFVKGSITDLYLSKKMVMINIDAMNLNSFEEKIAEAP